MLLMMSFLGRECRLASATHNHTLCNKELEYANHDPCRQLCTSHRTQSTKSDLPQVEAHHPEQDLDLMSQLTAHAGLMQAGNRSMILNAVFGHELLDSQGPVRTGSAMPLLSP